MRPDLSPEFLALQQLVAGRYSLEHELGRGGMGIVFLARDVALDRPVAIKLLPPALSRVASARERFLREARTAARLSHPHIVPIHAVEAHDDLAFFVMSYIDGETLGARVQRAGALPPHEAMRIVQEVAWALGHAHAHGVVHRDVKPDNILLERGSGRALVTDFGIAHLEERSHVSDPRGVAGTPRWMSPEHAAGEPVDARSDIYALGLVAWFTLTGRHPFEADTLLALRQRQLSEPAPSLAIARPSAPPALSRVLERALAGAPAQRFQSADEMAEALRTTRGADPAVAAPVRRFVADAEAAGSEIGTALTAGTVAFGMYAGVYPFIVDGSGFLFSSLITAVAYLSVTGVSVGLAGIRFGQLIDRARLLLRSGYGYDAVRPAIEVAERERAEDRLADPAQRRSVARETALLATLGAAKTALAVWLSDANVPDMLQLLGFVGTVAIPTVTIRKIWSETRRDRPSVWNRLMAGRLGRAVFRIARIRLREGMPALPAAGEPTALAVGRAADALFDALPRTQREHLREVPQLIERLEADALVLRARTGDPRSPERLATVVAALETLRLDLLRLHAGTATLDELTAHLDAARHIGIEIDAKLDAERMLDESPTPA